MINDAGQAFSKTGWEQSESVPIIEVNRREHSIARNSGAALAWGLRQRLAVSQPETKSGLALWRDSYLQQNG